jgi:hypothetical protein
VAATPTAEGPPRIALAVTPTGVPVGAGNAPLGLQVTIAARPHQCTPANTLQELRFGDDPRVYRNAAIYIDAGLRQPPFTVTLPPGTTEKSFWVVPLSSDQAATVPVVAVDGCGPWETLVGGGAALFQTGGGLRPAGSTGGGPQSGAPTRSPTPSVSPTASPSPRPAGPSERSTPSPSPTVTASPGTAPALPRRF